MLSSLARAWVGSLKSARLRRLRLTQTLFNRVTSSLSSVWMALIRLSCTEQARTSATLQWRSASMANYTSWNLKMLGIGQPTVFRGQNGLTGLSRPRTLASMSLGCLCAKMSAIALMRTPLRNSSHRLRAYPMATTTSSMAGLILQTITGPQWCLMKAFLLYLPSWKRFFLKRLIFSSPRHLISALTRMVSTSKNSLLKLPHVA